MKLAEIAKRINVHLKRFEADPVLNKRDKNYGTLPYYHAGAAANGRWLRVWYITYQGGDNLARADAEQYLGWLDAGNVGQHYKALREGSAVD